MLYRKILVPIFGVASDESILMSAFRLGQQFSAHVVALFVRLDPVQALPYGYEGDPSGLSAHYAIEAAVRAADAAQKVATDAFRTSADKSGIEVCTQPGARTSATTELKITQGDFADEVERESRLCNLIVFGAPDGERNAIRSGFEAALLSGTRPVLIVPREPGDGIGLRVAIAFDGSAASAHAVTASHPFLSRARGVHSFEVTEDPGPALSLRSLRDYLALHGINVIEHTIHADSRVTADALVSAVKAQHCDLLVLGGYGHSRLREFVLGGVTRSILRSDMPFAVLMAH
jgi:nucleotide-binding universal stress UspA family protein